MTSSYEYSKKFTHSSPPEHHETPRVLHLVRRRLEALVHQLMPGLYYSLRYSLLHSNALESTSPN